MLHQRLVFISLFIFLLIITSCQSETSSKTEGEDINEVDKKEEVLQLPDNVLQKGDKNDEILSLQHHMIQLGYPIEATGRYDENTTWAITDFQLHEDLTATGIYEEETKEAIQEAIDDQKTIETGKHLPQPTNDDPSVIENPYEVLALVNKEHTLPEDYVPHDLVIPDVRFPFTEDLPKKQLREIAAEALEELFAAGDEAGMDLFAVSGYRSYERQDAIFAANIDEHGEEAANTFSAKPGESEHQSGLTMDITSPEVDYDLTTEFGETEEGKWVKEHASDFGFIIRYPEEKEDITEYQYEPWHLRYVGKKAAKEIMKNDLTLEEYLEVQ